MEHLATKLFTHKSEAYANYRPGYPSEVIDLILNPFLNQQAVHAVDMGAGTGIASRLMANRGVCVTALEPNGAMIDAAEQHPNLNYLQARAEWTPIDTNVADVVTSFQAFHWFDFKLSLKEFNRILKPSGHLALVWSYWDPEDAFTASYIALIDEATQQNPSRIEPYDGLSGMLKKMRVKTLWKFNYLPFFCDVKRHPFKFYQEMDLNGLIGCARSQSYVVHQGPIWDDLIRKIEHLHSQTAVCRLAYNINLFLAKPVKR